jgi:hypothetical protein
MNGRGSSRRGQRTPGERRRTNSRRSLVVCAGVADDVVLDGFDDFDDFGGRADIACRPLVQTAVKGRVLPRHRFRRHRFRRQRVEQQLINDGVTMTSKASRCRVRSLHQAAIVRR